MIPFQKQSQLVDRMVRAARLDITLYDEVVADPTATRQAIMVVLIASLSAGIGSVLLRIMGDARGGQLVLDLIYGAIFSLVGWFFWSFLIYWLGTTLFQGRATYGQLLRGIGFSNSPAVIGFFVFIPVLGSLIAMGALLWTLLAMIIAVRQALEFTMRRATATCLVGWLVLLVLFVLLSLII
ncbi:MAG: YIP1 family protein [Chloroflexi bacterium]|nr:YIP1 family protein [Chloroflexota bacterium]